MQKIKIMLVIIFIVSFFVGCTTIRSIKNDTKKANDINTVSDATNNYGGLASVTGQSDDKWILSRTGVSHNRGRAATQIVCSSNAKNTSDCDQVVDGTADDIEINSAIGKLPNSGGRVLLSEGTFNITGTIHLLDDMILEGQGRATLISTTMNIPLVSANSVSNIIVRNLRVDGDSDPADIHQAGIQFMNVTDSVIENVWVTNCGRDGIQLLFGNHRITVANSFVENCQDDGINLGGGTTPASSEIIVIGNHVQNSGFAGIHASWGHSHVSIANNTLLNNGIGIDLLLESSSSSLATIQSNVIHTTTSHGISVSSNSAISEVVIDGNIIDDAGNQGIRIGALSGGWIVVNNIVRTSKNHGIIYSAHLIADRDLIISNNYITGGNSLSGITIYNSENAIIEGNIITDILSKWSIHENGDSNNNWILNNKVDKRIIASANSAVRGNMGWVTENRGTATINSQSTSTLVSHGLSSTPSDGDCWFIGSKNPTNDVGTLWIDSYTSTQMRLNVQNDPGNGDFKVMWQCAVLFGG